MYNLVAVLLFILVAGTPASANPGVWSLAPTASGFQWVSPTGNALCKYAALSMVDSTHLQAKVVPIKYATWGVWAAAQNTRLQSWGFDAAGMYSYQYQTDANWPAGGVPYAVTLQSSSHAARGDYPYHCKNINHNYTGMVCGNSFYQPHGGGQLDVFDTACDAGSGVSGAYAADVAVQVSELNSFGPDMRNAIILIPEEADDLYGLNHIGHEDLGYVIAASNPSMASSYNNGYAYTDRTLYAKMALKSFLAREYGTLASLNTAWGTNYTTFDTSDPNGDAGIKSGTYASYGTGTGLLDENGARILPASPNCNNLVSSDSWSLKTATETDLHTFVAYFAQTYGQKLVAAWNTIKPRPPIFVPIYDGPTYVYAAIAPSLLNGDGFWIAPDERTSEVQRIISAVPGKPIIEGDYSSANPDSPFSGSKCSSTPTECYSTQASRGAGMVSFWRNSIHLQDATGKHTVVGLEHWGLYDQGNESMNFGLVTADHDNPYDGSANVKNGEARDYGDAITPIAAFLKSGICDP